jgi:hypothetical protein
MISNILRYTVLILLIFLSFCTKQRNGGHDKKNEVTLIPSGQIVKIPIDSNTTLDCMSMFYYKDRDTGEEYLTYLNSYKNEVQFYNLKSQKLEHKVTCALEGPDGVGEISGFRVISRDSIYLTSRWSIFLVNSNGNIMDKIDYSKGTFIEDNAPLNKVMPSPYISSSRVYTPLVVKDNKLYITQALTYNAPYLPKIQMAPSLNSKVCLVIKKNGLKEFLPMEHPLANVEGLSNKHFSREFDGNNFVYSFFEDPDVYVTKDHVHVVKYSVHSRFIDKIVHLKNKSMSSFEKYNVDYIKDAYYFNLIYDKYRKIYYRFVKLPDKYKEGDDLMRLVKYPQNFSIIVLNKDFQVIGETKLPTATYEYKNFFVAEKGLYLSINHIDNPNLDIDHLQFELIKVQYNETNK